MLSCSCEWDPEPGYIYITSVSDYRLAPNTVRRHRCQNCQTMIEKQALCVEFKRVKIPEHEVELNIYGEEGEIPRSSHWLCEDCADIWFSLEELGFCVPINEVSESLKDYQHGQW